MGAARSCAEKPWCLSPACDRDGQAYLDLVTVAKLHLTSWAVSKWEDGNFLHIPLNFTRKLKLLSVVLVLPRVGSVEVGSEQC